jgi:hypothetical protein
MIESSKDLDSPSQEPLLGSGTLEGIEDPDFDDSWLDDGPPLAHEETVARRNATLRAFAVDPEEVSAIVEADGGDPVTPQEFETWLVGLSNNEKAQIELDKEEKRRAQDLTVRVHEKLKDTVPDLYLAKLPPELQARLHGLSYALGFNQSGTFNIEDARRYLTHESGGGINVTNYNYNQRFLLFDPAMREQIGDDNSTLTRAIDEGYTGISEIGRFVVAFPVVYPRGNNLSASEIVELHPEEALPEDFEIPVTNESSQQLKIVNGKYIAGYIDDEGTFWENANFTQSNQVDFKELSQSDFI